MTLFILLKIILLQYFQFLVISGIQSDLYITITFTCTKAITYYVILPFESFFSIFVIIYHLQYWIPKKERRDGKHILHSLQWHHHLVLEPRIHRCQWYHHHVMMMHVALYVYHSQNYHLGGKV